MENTHKQATATRLLTVNDLRREYRLGRGTAYLLLGVLPCVRVGKRVLLRRDDVEAFLERAATEGQDIRALALEAQKGKNPGWGAGKR